MTSDLLFRRSTSGIFTTSVSSELDVRPPKQSSQPRTRPVTSQNHPIRQLFDTGNEIHLPDLSTRSSRFRRCEQTAMLKERRHVNDHVMITESSHVIITGSRLCDVLRQRGLGDPSSVDRKEKSGDAHLETSHPVSQYSGRMMTPYVLRLLTKQARCSYEQAPEDIRNFIQPRRLSEHPHSGTFNKFTTITTKLSTSCTTDQSTSGTTDQFTSGTSVQSTSATTDQSTGATTDQSTSGTSDQSTSATTDQSTSAITNQSTSVTTDQFTPVTKKLSTSATTDQSTHAIAGQSTHATL